MAPHHVPDGFTAVTPYLTVDGASRLIEFITRVFDAEEVARYEEDGKIRHATYRIGDAVIELSDSTKQWAPTPASLHVYVPDTDAVYGRALAAGATSLYEPADMFYGERSGGVRDPLGNNWYIATFKEDVPDDEMQRRMATAKLKS